jgi:hypothetical protein
MIADVSPVVIPYPDELDLVPGDYIKSPGGVYYATLLTNGQFVVSQGTDPAISGLHPVWETSPVTKVVNPAIGFAGGAAIIYSRTEPDIYDGFGNFSNPEDGTVVSLADNGTLTVDSGTKPGHPVQQTFSNNVDDPLVKYDMTGITYDLAHPTITSSSPIAGLVFIGNNTAGTLTQEYDPTLTLTYTKASTWGFSVSEAVTLGLKETVDVGVPGVGKEATEFNLSETTTIGSSLGETTTKTTTYSIMHRLSVPAHSKYEAIITATQDTFEIPFTYTGIAEYEDGATVPVDGSGMFKGTDTGVFEVTTTCISDPHGCVSPTTLSAPDPAPVPEPSTWAMLLIGFLGVGAAGYRASRSKRADESATALRG